MRRNQTANDSLSAMHQMGILTPDQYKSVMGKSLGAKEQMAGMFANEWMAQQAQARELQKLQAAGQVQLGVSAGELQQKIGAYQGGYGRAIGLNPQEMPLQLTPQSAPGATSQSAPVLAPLQGRGAPVLRSNLSGGPLGSGAGISSPQIVTSPALQNVQAQRAQQQVTVAEPLGNKPIPPGSQHGTMNGVEGYFMPGANTFYPLK